MVEQSKRKMVELLELKSFEVWKLLMVRWLAELSAATLIEETAQSMDLPTVV